MTDAARHLSDAEIAERKAFLRQWGLDRPKPSADVVSLDTKRRPLGLGIVRDADDEPERDASTYTGGDLEHGPIVDFDDIAQETLNQPADVGLVYVSLNAAVSASEKSHQKLKTKVVELETELARERAAVAELRATQHEHAFILERLRIEGKGPPGVAGPRGVDGRDGARGSRGERGAMGPPGPRPVAWDIDSEQFAVTVLMSDGRRGPTLHLRALFEEFSAQIDASDAAEEHDAVQAQRAVVEREAANVRAGLPAR